MAEEKKETLSDELASLLKVNNKGWKTTLFQDTRKIETMICGNCKGICDNATEFDCDDDHDDAELYFYCRKCIQELITSHNGNCPINEHSNPKISHSRTANRRIKKSMVFCPYSKQYKIKEMKNKKQNNNAQVVDTMGEDEKEGIAIAANDQNKPELSFINGCSFNGKFDDLLINHFKECVEKYNPYFLMNITIRKLKYENKLQAQEINELQQDIKLKEEQINNIMYVKQENKILKQENNSWEKKYNLIKKENLKFSTDLETVRKQMELMRNEKDKEIIILQNELSQKAVQQILNNEENKQELKMNDVEQKQSHNVIFVLNKYNEDLLQLSNNNKTVTWKGGLFNYGRILMMGRYLREKEKLTIYIKIQKVKGNTNHYEFGFIGELMGNNWIGFFYTDNRIRQTMCIRGNGMIRINQKEQTFKNLNPDIKHETIYPNMGNLLDLKLKANIIGMSVNMETKTGFVWNENKKQNKFKANLPNVVAIAIGFFGTDSKSVSIHKVICDSIE